MSASSEQGQLPTPKASSAPVPPGAPKKSVPIAAPVTKPGPAPVSGEKVIAATRPNASSRENIVAALRKLIEGLDTDDKYDVCLDKVRTPTHPTCCNRARSQCAGMLRLSCAAHACLPCLLHTRTILIKLGSAHAAWARDTAGQDMILYFQVMVHTKRVPPLCLHTSLRHMLTMSVKFTEPWGVL